jgi:choline dehydrogenase
MIELYREAEPSKALARNYDYVIVGAGSAGCAVARRLVDGCDATILLLEAGGAGEGVASLSNPPQWAENLGSPYDWADRYEPSQHVAGRSIPLALGQGARRIGQHQWHGLDPPSRLRRLGAGGQCRLGLRSVLPLFKKSEDWEDGASEFRGVGGPIHVERAKELHPVPAAFIDAGRSCGMPYSTT